MTLPNRGKHLSRAGQRRLSPAAWAKSEKTFRRRLRQTEEKDGLAVEKSEDEESNDDDDEMSGV